MQTIFRTELSAKKTPWQINLGQLQGGTAFLLILSISRLFWIGLPAGHSPGSNITTFSSSNYLFLTSCEVSLRKWLQKPLEGGSRLWWSSLKARANRVLVANLIMLTFCLTEKTRVVSVYTCLWWGNFVYDDFVNVAVPWLIDDLITHSAGVGDRRNRWWIRKARSRINTKVELKFSLIITIKATFNWVCGGGVGVGDGIGRVRLSISGLDKQVKY